MVGTSSQVKWLKYQLKLNQSLRQVKLSICLKCQVKPLQERTFEELLSDAEKRDLTLLRFKTKDSQVDN